MAQLARPALTRKLIVALFVAGYDQSAIAERVGRRINYVSVALCQFRRKHGIAADRGPGAVERLRAATIAAWQAEQD